MNQIQCHWCNNEVLPIDVHGHLQCPHCKTNIDPCCSGEVTEKYSKTIYSCNTKRYDE